MAYIEVDVDIDIEDYIDEIDTDNLIEELKGRSLSSRQIMDVMKIAGFNNSKSTLLDQMKMDAVQNGIKDKTLTEIENFFKK